MVKLSKRIMVFAVLLTFVGGVLATNTSFAMKKKIPKNDDCEVTFFPTGSKSGPKINIFVPSKAACKLAEVHNAIIGGKGKDCLICGKEEPPKEDPPKKKKPPKKKPPEEEEKA